MLLRLWSVSLLLAIYEGGAFARHNIRHEHLHAAQLDHVQARSLEERHADHDIERRATHSSTKKQTRKGKTVGKHISKTTSVRVIATPVMRHTTISHTLAGRSPTASKKTTASKPTGKLIGTTYKPTKTTTTSSSTTKPTTTSTKPTTSSTSKSTSSRSSSTTTRISTTTTSSTSVPLGKRGLSYNSARLTQPFGTRNTTYTSQVSWMYNWYSAPCTTSSSGSDCTYSPLLQFIPTLFSNASDLTSIWASNVEIALARGTRSLFSFNEPDACFFGGACMDLAYAVTAYKKHMQPFAGRALLGAPAVTNAGAPHGLDWLSRFMTACDGCTFDFINVHWYSNRYAGIGYFKSFIEQARVLAKGRPIWVTEFALDASDGGTPSDADQRAFMIQAAAYLDAQPDVAGYAWFMDAPGILIENEAKASLSVLGQTWDGYWNGTTKGGIAV